MADYVVVRHSTGIPQLIILTHVDQVCPAVEEDVKHVYSSRTVQDKVLIEMTVTHFPVLLLKSLMHDLMLKLSGPVSQKC